MGNFVFFFLSEPRLDKNPFGNGFGPPGGPGAGGPPGLNPMAAQFMALNHPAAAAQAAFLQQSGLPAHFAAAAAAGIPGAAAAAAAAAAASVGVTGVTSSPTMSGGSPFPGRQDPLLKGPGIASLEALQR